ncbi:GDSL esterase/lipase At5g14450-like [Rhodamnia argentea]|uniref:GDSL esterase/lipase At5g14450-like n=1 Tax=Rhodamnia argentea TaxID=178133 RepID=A0ABM3HST7_9MYRT|nr:GDSL esterase/lipase At5g14450-like [Rhodamnia argentea]
MVSSSSSSCNFPAIYNFGDSNSDTGGRSAALTQIPPPYGETNLGNPPKRGIIGFLELAAAEKLGLPYMSAYLDSVGTNFGRGVNFAATNSSNLAIQTNVTVDQTVATIPGILDAAIQQLYGEGARAFWIHNTGPIGCLPFMAVPFKFRNGTLNQNGCVAYQNDVVQEFNQQLKERVNNLSVAAFTYVDLYSAKLSLISDAKNQGFVDPLNYCCGTFVPTFVMCGLSAHVNGTTVHGDACGDPQDQIGWDSIHFTDAANSWISSRILNCSMSDPPSPISSACP